MSQLRFERKVFPSAHFGAQADMPSMLYTGRGLIPTELDEDDELFINYGTVTDLLPYQQQDKYDRALEPTEYPVAVLENEHLRATFTPTFGGKLWSLFDKDADRELLNVNPVVRPCNLALRNAWMCGGVEWNIGMTGHSPFTCEPIFTARLTGRDGEPILRFYEYERKRGSVYQMDFTLPSGSRFLYARMRIVNPNETVIPMYWWSTVAVDEDEGSRMVVPADEAYITGGGYPTVCKRPIPVPETYDVTYGIHNRNSIDYFFKIKNERRYMSQLNKDGYGLLQSSTSRLRGRKLFVWGQGAGGKRWQQYLTEGGKPYVEIQAGLARTQLESLPMPARTAWEWIEAYGPITAQPQQIHGDWATARATVEAYLDANCPQSELEQRLLDTREDALTPATELIQCGSGWGALEILRREKMGERGLPEHLDFGKTGTAQQLWVDLLETGAFPELCPSQPLPSYEIRPQWMKLLAAAPKTFATELMLGLGAYAECNFPLAESHFMESLRLAHTCVGLYCMGNLRRAEGIDLKGEARQAKLALACDYFYAAAMLAPQDTSLVRETLKMLTGSAGRYREALELIANLPASTAIHGNVKLMRAIALAKTGEYDAAREALYENGGLEIPDLREGENSISDLWFYLEEKRAEAEGRPYDEKTLTPPDFANFRMMIE